MYKRHYYDNGDVLFTLIGYVLLLTKCRVLDPHLQYQPKPGCDTCRELFTFKYSIMLHMLHIHFSLLIISKIGSECPVFTTFLHHRYIAGIDYMHCVC